MSLSLFRQKDETENCQKENLKIRIELRKGNYFPDSIFIKESNTSSPLRNPPISVSKGRPPETRHRSCFEKSSIKKKAQEPISRNDFKKIKLSL